MVKPAHFLSGTVRYPFPPAGPYAESINGTVGGYPGFNPAVGIHSTTDLPAVSHGGVILAAAADSGNHVGKPENPSPVH
uniref:Uncharacterized protein n=1 Tax=Arion vulgaris TaxID=1028688 RepID=A0A0B7ARP6_9EUPU